MPSANKRAKGESTLTDPYLRSLFNHSEKRLAPVLVKLARVS